jgi:hypothetical protein
MSVVVEVKDSARFEQTQIKSFFIENVIADQKFIEACKRANIFYEVLFPELEVKQTVSGLSNLIVFYKLKSLAKAHGIAVCAELEEEYQKLLHRLKNGYFTREIEGIRHLNEERQKEGCGSCQDCKQCGDGDYYCAYSGDDLNSKIADEWDGMAGVHYCFAEKAYPSENCKHNEELKIIDNILEEHRNEV